MKKINKAMKIVGTIRKLNSPLPTSSLMTLYKSFVRPHLDYDDVIYDKPNNQRFIDKIESVQYNSVLAFTGAIVVLLKINVLLMRVLKTTTAKVYLILLLYQVTFH